MRPKWLVERDVFGTDLNPLIDEIKRQGMQVEVLTYIPFEGGSYNVFQDDDCVLCYASLNLVKQLQRQKPWVPGSFCNLPNFECSRYYAHFGKYLLNSTYTMLPLAELKRRKAELLQQFSNLLFVRPSNGFKTFAGIVVADSTFDQEYSWWEEFATPESLVVVAPAVDITTEWRIVIADRKAIAASQYKINSELEVQEGCPANVVEFANEMTSVKWQPDPIYVMDIGQLIDGTLKLIELNSFSCSGLYDCKLENIVAEASRLAEVEWNEVNKI